MTVAVLRAAFGSYRVSEVERDPTTLDERKALTLAAVAVGRPESEGTVSISGNVARVSFAGFSPVILLLHRDTVMG